MLTNMCHWQASGGPGWGNWNQPAGSSYPGDSCMAPDGSPMGMHGAICGCDGVCYAYSMGEAWGAPLDCLCTWTDSGFGSGNAAPGEPCLSPNGNPLGPHGATCSCGGECHGNSMDGTCPSCDYSCMTGGGGGSHINCPQGYIWNGSQCVSAFSGGSNRPGRLTPTIPGGGKFTPTIPGGGNQVRGGRHPFKNKTSNPFGGSRRTRRTGRGIPRKGKRR